MSQGHDQFDGNTWPVVFVEFNEFSLLHYVSFDTGLSLIL